MGVFLFVVPGGAVEATTGSLPWGGDIHGFQGWSWCHAGSVLTGDGAGTKVTKDEAGVGCVALGRDFWAWGDPNLTLLGLAEWLHPYCQSHIHEDATHILELWTRAQPAKKTPQQSLPGSREQDGSPDLLPALGISRV